MGIKEFHESLWGDDLDTARSNQDVQFQTRPLLPGFRPEFTTSSGGFVGVNGPAAQPINYNVSVFNDQGEFIGSGPSRVAATSQPQDRRFIQPVNQPPAVQTPTVQPQQQPSFAFSAPPPTGVDFTGRRGPSGQELPFFNNGRFSGSQFTPAVASNAAPAGNPNAVTSQLPPGVSELRAGAVDNLSSVIESLGNLEFGSDQLEDIRGFIDAGGSERAQSVLDEIGVDTEVLRSETNAIVDARVTPLEQQRDNELAAMERDFERRGVFGSIASDTINARREQFDRQIAEQRSLATQEALQQVLQRQSVSADIDQGIQQNILANRQIYAQIQDADQIQEMQRLQLARQLGVDLADISMDEVRTALGEIGLSQSAVNLMLQSLQPVTTGQSGNTTTIDPRIATTAYQAAGQGFTSFLEGIGSIIGFSSGTPGAPTSA